MSADEILGTAMLVLALIGAAYWLPLHITGTLTDEDDR